MVSIYDIQAHGAQDRLPSVLRYRSHHRRNVEHLRSTSPNGTHMSDRCHHSAPVRPITCMMQGRSAPSQTVHCSSVPRVQRCECRMASAGRGMGRVSDTYPLHLLIQPAFGGNKTRECSDEGQPRCCLSLHRANRGCGYAIKAECLRTT